VDGIISLEEVDINAKANLFIIPDSPSFPSLE
jgi:hypothetical protein